MQVGREAAGTGQRAELDAGVKRTAIEDRGSEVDASRASTGRRRVIAAVGGVAAVRGLRYAVGRLCNTGGETWKHLCSTRNGSTGKVVLQKCTRPQCIFSENAKLSSYAPNLRGLLDRWCWQNEPSSVC